jgi:hypothetical protein
MGYCCEVVTQWIVGDDGVLRTAVDMTGQPDVNLVPDPNNVVVRGDHLADDQMSKLLANANAVVLWYEEEK